MTQTSTISIDEPARATKPSNPVVQGSSYTDSRPNSSAQVINGNPTYTASHSEQKFSNQTLNPKEKIADAPSSDELRTMMDPNKTYRGKAADNRSETEKTYLPAVASSTALVPVDETNKKVEEQGFWSKWWDYVVDQVEKKEGRQIDFSEKTKKILDYVHDDLSKHTAYLTAAANIFAGFFHWLSSASQETKELVTKVTEWITKLSFIPYSADGMIDGMRKRNPFQTVAFSGETIFAAMSDTEDMYLRRGPATGADQWALSTEVITKKKYPSNVFPSFRVGATEVLNATFDLLKQTPDKLNEIWQEFKVSPWNAIKNFKPDGVPALWSSIGDIIAGLVYMMVGKSVEKPMGWLRDFSAFLFDFEMVFRDNWKQKLAGWLFLAESGTDGVARYLSPPLRKLFNHSSISLGRIALQTYLEQFKDDQKVTVDPESTNVQAKGTVTVEAAGAVQPGEEVVDADYRVVEKQPIMLTSSEQAQNNSPPENDFTAYRNQVLEQQNQLREYSQAA